MKVIPALILSFALLFLSVDVSGQVEDETVRVETELVSINVAVAGADGKRVA